MAFAHADSSNGYFPGEPGLVFFLQLLRTCAFFWDRPQPSISSL